MKQGHPPLVDRFNAFVSAYRRVSAPTPPSVLGVLTLSALLLPFLLWFSLARRLFWMAAGLAVGAVAQAVTCWALAALPSLHRFVQGFEPQWALLLIAAFTLPALVGAFLQILFY